MRKKIDSVVNKLWLFLIKWCFYLAAAWAFAILVVAICYQILLFIYNLIISFISYVNSLVNHLINFISTYQVQILGSIVSVLLLLFILIIQIRKYAEAERKAEKIKRERIAKENAESERNAQIAKNKKQAEIRRIENDRISKIAKAEDDKKYAELAIEEEERKIRNLYRLLKPTECK
jgi:low affinity Fe/Cu permease